MPDLFAKDSPRQLLEPELIDQANMPPDELRRSLLDLRRVNRWFGGRRLLLEALELEVRRCGLQQFSVLDVASGSGDLPLAMVQWARERRLQPRVVALEFWHRYLALFADELKIPGLYPLCADAFRLPFPEKSFDFVTCSLFMHHLTEQRTAELLRSMSRCAKRAVIVNDLERHRLAYNFFWLFSGVLLSAPMSRTDGLISIRQSFRAAELRKIAAAAGLEATVERRWPFRLMLVARTD